MKRFCLLLLASMLIFSGCYAEIGTQEDAGEEEFVYQAIDLEPEIVKSVSLYFLAADGDRLAAETREFVLEQNVRAEYQIVEALLAGPQDKNLREVGSGYTLDYIEMLYNVANVYLETGEVQSEYDTFVLAMAVTNTISDYSSVTYVNVYINGRALSYEGEPVGALSKNQNIISDEIVRQQQRAANGQYATVLYFLDPSEEYIVPEVRTIQYGSDDYASAIVAELAKGPQEMYTYNASVPAALKTVAQTSYEESPYGRQIMLLDVNRSPLTYGADNEICAASICYSVCGFVPETDGIKFKLFGENINNFSYDKELFRSRVGAEMYLCFAGGDGTTLAGTTKTVEQAIAGMPQHVVEELINGTADTGIEGVENVFPDGVKTSDLLNVYVAGDTAVVDWSSSILEKVKGITLSEERILVYSVVNTLTYLKDIRRVQFLINGVRTQEFAGYLDIRDPLFKNPGLIKY